LALVCSFDLMAACYSLSRNYWRQRRFLFVRYLYRMTIRRNSMILYKELVQVLALPGKRQWHRRVQDVPQVLICRLLGYVLRPGCPKERGKSQFFLLFPLSLKIHLFFPWLMDQPSLLRECRTSLGIF